MMKKIGSYSLLLLLTTAVLAVEAPQEDAAPSVVAPNQQPQQPENSSDDKIVPRSRFSYMDKNNFTQTPPPGYTVDEGAIPNEEGHGQQ